MAKDFNIAEVVDDWHALIARADIDTIFIGTWPYMHREMSVAALNAGKHVFCQARMANDLAQAKAMVEAAHAHPKLVHMVCPPPTRMPFEPYIQNLLGTGQLGTLTAVELYAVGGGNLDANKISGRECGEFSGKQILAMGIYAETLNAWLGPYEELSARLATPIPVKTDPSTHQSVRIDIPQVVTITGKLKSGRLAYEHHSGLATDKSTPEAPYDLGPQGDAALCVWRQTRISPERARRRPRRGSGRFAPRLVRGTGLHRRRAKRPAK